MIQDRKKNNDGIVFVYVIIICSFIMICITSIITLLNDEQVYSTSQINGTKAYYLAESALDDVLNTIYLTADDIIEEYLVDLRVYKVHHIINKNENHNAYNPPLFSNYIYTGLISKLSAFKNEVKNPFEEYNKEHSYKIGITYNAPDKIIVDAVGTYERTRRFLRLELLIPKAIEDGMDEHNLPKIKIKSMYIKSKYQTFGE